jgi:hypothetical protein
MKRNDLGWGIVLVLIGSVLLLNRFLEVNIWRLAGPLLLIGVGLWILWSSQTVGEIEEETIHIPLKGARRAEIHIRHGAGHLDVSAGESPDIVVSGSFRGGMAYERHRPGDAVSLKMRVRNHAPWTWFSERGFNWNTKLNKEIPLALHIEGGLSENHLDLTDLQVTDLHIEGGLSSTEITLPAHAGTNQAHLESGLASLNVRIPEGVAARVRSESGLSSVNVDEERFPKSGDVYRSPDFDGAENRVDIRVESGLGSVKIS